MIKRAARAELTAQAPIYYCDYRPLEPLLLAPPLREPPPPPEKPPPEKPLDDELREPLLNDDELLYEFVDVVLRDEELLREELLYVEDRSLLLERPFDGLCGVTVDWPREPVTEARPTEPLRCCSNADA